MLKKIVVALLGAAVFLSAGAAVGITYGQPDNGRHPNVGAMVRLRADGVYRILCSGSLASPTVFITASHCTRFLENQGIEDAWVTFDQKFTQKSKLIHVTMHSNPAYTQSQDDSGDLAVLTLDKAVTGITPVQLPTANLLDRMKADGTLNGTLFTSVGYGIQEPKTGAGGITHDFPMERWYAVGEFAALTQSWLKIAQTQATGDGGTCSGDSGGPQFLGAGANETNIQVSITITGDLECFATNVDYRLDTAAARAFLGQFLTLP